MTMRCTGEGRMGHCMYEMVQSKPEQIDCRTEHTGPGGKGDLWVAPLTAAVSFVMGLSTYFQVDRLQQAFEDSRKKLEQQQKKRRSSRSIERLVAQDELVDATENAFMVPSRVFRGGGANNDSVQQQGEQEEGGGGGRDVEEEGGPDETTNQRGEP